MNKQACFKISLTEQEITFGWIYVAVEFLALPALLNLLCTKLFPHISSSSVNFLFFLINFLAISIIFRHFLRGSLSDFSKNYGPCLLYVLLGFVIYEISVLVLSHLTFLLCPNFVNINDQSISQISRQGYWTMAAGVVMLVPTVEECLFRGLMFRGFYRKSRLFAYAFSSLFFCSVHVVGYAGMYNIGTILLCFIQYLPAGLCLCWTYEKSGSIITPILIHTVINVIGIYALR